MKTLKDTGEIFSFSGWIKYSRKIHTVAANSRTMSRKSVIGWCIPQSLDNRSDWYNDWNHSKMILIISEWMSVLWRFGGVNTKQQAHSETVIEKTAKQLKSLAYTTVAGAHIVYRWTNRLMFILKRLRHRSFIQKQMKKDLLSSLIWITTAAIISSLNHFLSMKYAVWLKFCDDFLVYWNLLVLLYVQLQSFFKKLFLLDSLTLNYVRW